MRKQGITWDVDGYGTRHFYCERCGKALGVLEVLALDHHCPEPKPGHPRLSRLDIPSKH